MEQNPADDVVAEQYYDYMNCKENKNITDELETDEKIIFSILLGKKSKWGFNQERIMLVTDKHYYNIDDNKIKRKVEIKNVYAFTKSLSCNDFILHVYNEYDY